MKNKIHILLILGVVSFNGCIKKDTAPIPYEKSAAYLQSMKAVQERTHSKEWVSVSSTSSFFVALKKDGRLFYEGYLPWKKLELLCGTDYVQPNSHTSNTTVPFKSSIKLKPVDYGTWIEAHAKDDKLIAKSKDGKWLVVEKDASKPYVASIQSTFISEDEALKLIAKKQESYLKTKIKADGTLWIGQAGKEKAFKQETSYANDWAMVSEGYISNVVALKKDGTLWFWRYPEVEKKKEANVVYENSPYEKTRGSK